MTSRTPEPPTFSTQKLRTVAVVSFSDEAEWSAIRRSALDSARLADSYPEWQEAHEAELARQRDKGLIPVSVPITADAYLSWCRDNGKAQDAISRALFAAEQMRALRHKR